MPGSPAFLRRVARRPSGYFVATGPGGVEDEGETLRCVHCQMHWRIEPGSGRQRGYCLRCNGPTCGKQECETRCVPFEKAIELAERREHLYRAAREAAGFSP